jgi:hypothetical protein
LPDSIGVTAIVIVPGTVEGRARPARRIGVHATTEGRVEREVRRLIQITIATIACLSGSWAGLQLVSFNNRQAWEEWQTHLDWSEAVGVHVRTPSIHGRSISLSSSIAPDTLIKRFRVTLLGEGVLLPTILAAISWASGSFEPVLQLRDVLLRDISLVVVGSLILANGMLEGGLDLMSGVELLIHTNDLVTSFS